MNFAFKTIGDFYAYFDSEAKCYEYLETKWWGGVPCCPFCGSDKFYKVKSRTKFDVPSYRCGNRPCSNPYTIRTKSIFEGSQIELRKWFQAVYELTTSKKGISSVELAVRIGTSQKTAWLINHKIREMLGVNSSDEPMGEGGQMVEVDETYVGGKVTNMTESKRRKIRNKELGGNDNKTTVMGFLERGGSLKFKVISKHGIQSSVLKTVSKEAVLMTDGFHSYKTIGQQFAGHEVVNHANKEFSRDHIFHTNGIEGAFSILDRAIMGIFHYVSPKHLQKYCDEISLKYNGRGESNAARFETVLSGSKVRRITYKELTKTLSSPSQIQPMK